MAAIDYYLSPISPWAYLAGDRPERIAERHGATITYRPLDIMQLFDRTGGTRPQNRHPSRLDYRKQELPRWAEHLGMPIRIDVALTNAAPAAYAIIAAQEAGGDVAALVRAILEARFAKGRDIAEDQVIRDALAKAGFDPGLADRGLFVGAEAYGRNLERAVEAGVFGVPFYHVLDTDQRFWGQDRLDFLDRHLASL
ncbi:2-hydroxychromene-2-carboxylate isomerase [Paracoccus sp. (in: a-proteobacteria)]|uniref:2-hydroxychromene-2-carboxylate isomerase n=1 Tax=Paracoccus sp. TaxID=267 RepID=UPI0026DFCF90|nr:2-hydroxychromene-2-carboxylate isomerase [Paracoccus sp. (in: a-proteobacteria)]MDO5369314.1 2-hydroxychromene-2-carboxylate isomerase [Paracoccus sp. (in: a-proteobacteria)]